MALTSQDIARVANLARLELRPDETERMLEPAQRLFHPGGTDGRRQHRRRRAAGPPCRGAGRGRPAPARRHRQRAEPARGQPGQRAGRRTRPVSGAEGDRMSAAVNTDLHDLGVAELAAQSGRPRGLQRRSHAAFPGTHRPARQPGRLSGDRPGRVAGAGPGRRRAAGRRRAHAAAGRAAGAQGRVRHARLSDHRRLENAGELPQPVRRHGGAPTGARGLAWSPWASSIATSSRWARATRTAPTKPVHNPWDTSRVPGGSSGGSAAAVAARLVPAATGTDTGGSIRQPASLTGITGIKPTYGRCSRYGMVAFASSLDQAGPMARSALDCALLLSAMAGPDLDRDSTSLDLPATDYATDLIAAHAGNTRGYSPKGLEDLRIGLPRQFFGAGCAPDVLAAVRAALAEFEKLGATLVDVDLPLTELSIPVYYVIAPAEASSNLSRFDGVRYGHRAAQLHRPDRHVQKVALRRLRRRGDAPHHDRHLRAVARLLRRLLPEGAENPPPDRRRLPEGLHAVRHHRRPGVAHRGVEAGRTSRTTRWPTTWPTSTPCRPAWRACPA